MKKQNSFNAIPSSASISNSTDDTFSSLTAGAGENPSAPAGAGVIVGGSHNADNSNSAKEEAKAEILAALEANGVDTGAFTLELMQFIDKDHRDVLWYGGVIAVVAYKGYAFSLEANGEINATLQDLNGDVICESQDKTASGGFYADMQKHIANDDELRELMAAGLLSLQNNNWLEIFVQQPNGNWMTQTWLSNDDDIVAGIVEMLETMEEILEDEESADCELRVFETAIDFARRWGAEEKHLESLKLYRSSAVKRWILLRSPPSDELAAMMHKWAKERAATIEQEPADEFFFTKLEELFRKEGL